MMASDHLNKIPQGFWAKYGSRLRWLLVAVVVAAGQYYAITAMHWGDYVASWNMVQFKVASGAFWGWFIGRFVMQIDLSAMPLSERVIGGLSYAILIGSFANALARGA